MILSKNESLNLGQNPILSYGQARLQIYKTQYVICLRYNVPARALNRTIIGVAFIAVLARASARPLNTIRTIRLYTYNMMLTTSITLVCGRKVYPNVAGAEFYHPRNPGDVAVSQNDREVRCLYQLELRVQEMVLEPEVRAADVLVDGTQCDVGGVSEAPRALARASARTCA